ncbi:MAG: hypothetical protein EXR77_14455 [Myxococcales bacterium]|nr:hypothetical protein [Myxococcales bacterium]
MTPLRVSSLVHLDWGGQFRSRNEAIGGVRVNSDNALLPTHMDFRHGSADKPGLPTDGRLYSADVRLRLEPTIAVGDWSTIGVQLDASGLLGSAPITSGLVERFAAGAVGQGALGAGLAVRRVWLQVQLQDLGAIEIGKMADHFGLGMVRNRGGGLDEDHQSDVDRVKIKTELFGIRGAIGRNNLASLPLVPEGGALANYNNAVAAQFGGTTAKPYLLGTGNTGLPIQDSTDVIRWDFEAGGGKLVNNRGFLWDLALLWQSQDLALVSETVAANEHLSPLTKLNDPTCGTNCGVLSHRGLRLWTFQGAVDWRGSALGSPLTLQAEAAFQYGSIARTDITAAADGKTIAAAGLAAKAAWQRGRSAWLLDLGAASGETDGGFGVNDTTNFKVGGVPDGAGRSLLTGFRFHRSYRVDGLLFRDLIGAVANAYYVRPAWRSAWPLTSVFALSAEVGVLGATAMFGGATPGKSQVLGLEPDLTIGVDTDRTRGQLRGALVVPGAAFANSAGTAADAAWRLDLIWQLRF